MTRLAHLHAAINRVRPWNGFITRAFILDGWTAQPFYGYVRVLGGAL